MSGQIHSFEVLPKPLHHLCTTFPPPPDKEVFRDHLIQTYQSVFSRDVDLLLLEGEEGVGKTTLLSQFARRFPNECISSFVTPTPRTSYNIETLRQDYSAQICHILQPDQPLNLEHSGDGIYESLIQKLKRRQGTNHFYFLLDGLTDIVDPIMMAEVLRLLPVGSGFRIVISGEARLLPPDMRDNRRTMRTIAIRFSLSEVQQYVADCDLVAQDVRLIYQACDRGLPAKLASMRRSLRSGVEVAFLRDKGFRQLLEVEWQRTITDALAEWIVAVVAHSQHGLSLDEISEILKVGRDDIVRRLRQLAFLQTSPVTSHISFVSRRFMEFAAEKLADSKKTVIDMLVDYVRVRGEGGDSLAIDSVPGYLQESGKLGEVISYLSPEYFERFLKKSGSFRPLWRQFEAGMDAAERLRQDGELFRFTLAGSAISEIGRGQVSRAEIEARVTVGLGAEALALATNCPLMEDRLHLLAVVARAEKERGSSVGDDVLGQIRRLRGQVDARSLGERGIDIAADLFACFPDLAIGLVEECAGADGDHNELDIAYVRLSIATAIRASSSGLDEDRLERVRDRIKDPRLRGFAASVTGRVQSASDVIAEVEKFESAADRLYVLRKWALEHSDREDAAGVTEYGLRTLVGATTYAPNIRVLRELSTPLIHSRDRKSAESLVESFDGQRATVDVQGPTEEVVRLNLNLSVAQSFYDMEGCVNRLVEVYLLVDELKDLSTKASCLARIISTLQLIDSDGRIEENEKLGSLSSQDLEAALSDLLGNTAEQIGVIKRTIYALSSFDVSRSISLAESLNTAARREEALVLTVGSILENHSRPIDLNQIRVACGRLRTSQSRDRIASSVAEYLVRRAGRDETEIVHSGCQLFRDLFFSVSEPMERCRVLSLLDALQSEGVYSESDGADQNLHAGLKETLSQLDPGWQRIEAGFHIARSLAERHTDVAKEFLQDAERERSRTALSSPSSEWAYQASLRLSIRAFAGQLGQGYDPQHDMSRITRLIDRIPGISRRVQLWGEVAMHLLLRKHSDDANRVVHDQLIPLLDLMYNGPERSDTIVAVAPALYRSHKTTTIQRLNTIEAHQKDIALMNCAEFILEKRVPSDPYESHDNGYDISYEEAFDITELAREISRDNLVYLLITALADTLSSPRWAKTFTPQQKTALADSIRGLSKTKFPDLDNIQHDGYAVASAAQLLRIERGSSNDWARVIGKAQSIPNTADRAFVLAIIAGAFKDATRRDELFSEGMEVAETIPCTYDRLDRLSDLAEMMSRRSPLLARNCIEIAIRSSQRSEEGVDGGLVRDLVDTAFKFDEEFAASLVSMMDDDPARARARHEMTERLNILRSKKAMLDGSDTSDHSALGGSELARSAWLALGSLNAGRVNTVRMEQLRPALRAAGRVALHNSYYVYLWVIENAVRRFGGTAESRGFIRRIFESSVSATELSEVASESAAVASRRVTPVTAFRVSERRLLVRRGERERAEGFLRRWLERSAAGFVYICDQYFGPTELDLLKLIQAVVPSIDVAVLTSRHHHDHRKIKDLAGEYRTGWQNISDQRPPRAEIVIVGLEGSGLSPIHDRSILTERSGLDIGTSWNSLGLSQDSKMSVLSDRDAAELSDRVREFLVGRKREYGSERLLYESVTL